MGVLCLRKNRASFWKKMKPIRSNQIVNYDFTSTLFWDGAEKKDSSKNSWARESEVSQSRGERNRTSAWVKNEYIKCIRLTVKWHEGAVTSGHFLPQVEMFSGLSEDEMPSDSFIALQVEDMCAVRNIDARKKSIGNIATLRSKQKWVPYFSRITQNILFSDFVVFSLSTLISELSTRDL